MYEACVYELSGFNKVALFIGLVHKNAFFVAAFFPLVEPQVQKARLPDPAPPPPPAKSTARINLSAKSTAQINLDKTRSKSLSGIEKPAPRNTIKTGSASIRGRPPQSLQLGGIAWCVSVGD